MTREDRQLEELLRATLGDRAELIEDPGPTDRANQVIAQARATSTRRVATTAGAVLLALALAGGGIYAARNLGQDTTPKPDPRGPVTASPSLPATTTPTPVRVKPSFAANVVPYRAATQLPTGEPLSFWRTEKRAGRMVLVTDAVRALPEGTGAGARILPIRDGWLLWTMGDAFTGGDTDPGARVIHVPRSGKAAIWAEGPMTELAISPDGQQVAWLAHTDDLAKPPVLTLHRVSDGSLVRRIPLKAALVNGMAVRGSIRAWTREGLLVSGFEQGPDGGFNRPMTLLDPGSGTMRKLADITDAQQLSSGKVVLMRLAGQQECAEVGDALSGGHRIGCGTNLDFNQAAQREGIVVQPGPTAEEPLIDPEPIWQVDPDGTVHPGKRPRWLAESFAVVEGPGRLVLQVTDNDDPSKRVFVRWRLDRGQLEQAPLPAGSGEIQS